MKSGTEVPLFFCSFISDLFLGVSPYSPSNINILHKTSFLQVHSLSFSQAGVAFPSISQNPCGAARNFVTQLPPADVSQKQYLILPRFRNTDLPAHALSQCKIIQKGYEQLS